MTAPNSLYEAIIKGLCDEKNINGRRSLFLFVVDHSIQMNEIFPATNKSKINSVVEALNEMKEEMNTVDKGEHLDLGFVGYPIKNGTTNVNSMWLDQNLFIQPVNTNSKIIKNNVIDDNGDSLYFAFENAMNKVFEWKKTNSNPIFDPVIINVTTSNSKFNIKSNNFKNIIDKNIHLFNCILDDHCSNNVVVPHYSEIKNDYHQELFEISSNIPPLITDLIDFCNGRVSNRFLNVVEDTAENYGINPNIAKQGAKLLGNILGGNIRIPSGRYGYSYGLKSEIKGLSLNCNKGFALIKGMIGFNLFVKLFN